MTNPEKALRLRIPTATISRLIRLYQIAIDQGLVVRNVDQLNPTDIVNDYEWWREKMVKILAEQKAKELLDENLLNEMLAEQAKADGFTS